MMERAEDRKEHGVKVDGVKARGDGTSKKEAEKDGQEQRDGTKVDGKVDKAAGTEDKEAKDNRKVDGKVDKAAGTEDKEAKDNRKVDGKEDTAMGKRAGARKANGDKKGGGRRSASTMSTEITGKRKRTLDIMRSL